MQGNSSNSYWDDCNYAGDYGWFPVPIDYNDPSDYDYYEGSDEDEDLEDDDCSNDSDYIDPEFQAMIDHELFLSMQS